mmetsp:Transcript_51367/g.135448  ORF Transcript_51367/g.135448 Transcript_51367/m.135448 type:complete len:251 (-) Transcript_51367:1509-2261(-)
MLFRLRVVNPPLPLVHCVGKMLLESLECWELRQAQNLVPRLFRQKIRWILQSPPDFHRRAVQQESQVHIIQLALGAQQGRGQRHREQGFVVLEQGPADVLVQRVNKVVLEGLQPLGEATQRRRFVNCLHEQALKPLQRILVHGVDLRKLRDGEEENGGLEGHWSVGFTRRINLSLGIFGFNHLLIDVLRCLLGRGQGIDQGLILQNVLISRAQQLQDRVFRVLQLFLHTSVGEHQHILPLLQVRALFGNH